MKKQMKALAVLSTAMFMAAVTPSLFPNVSTVYAKNVGWTEENGNWYYYDSYGDPLTDTWKKNGSDWYYLDSDGIRASNMQIDEYYVGEDGKRVSMKWVSVENEDYWSEEDAPEFLYYYYGRDGKALTSTWASINGQWYYFNEDSIMETGSIAVDGCNYYLGEDGSRKTGWILLEEETDDPETLEYWYYFDNSGKRVENEVDRKIDGAYYTFVDGRMQTGWFKLPAAAAPAQDQAATPSEATPSEAAPAVSAEPTVAGYQYYDEDGKRASGWRTIEGVENLSEDGELYNFYFKNGAPYHAESGLELFTVDSKKYAFNTKGEMQTGKQVVNTGEGLSANYFFDENGVMKTGKQTIYDEDLGETQNWFFHTDGSKKGQGYHGIKDNTLYIYGLRQDADKDLRFAPAEFEGNRYLVNANGAVQKAGSTSKSSERPELGNGFKDFKDTNETIWTVNTEGIIQ
ncbi:cell wall-binding protein [Lacrimispora sp. 210928-DFI.3.58]|uniref:cell wall-binding protein n=1 Tax=Lacrimispora sp. 210928-DFI.3.58 TaxID=2883214 RepID=UPI0015B472A2|nr:cell wall-binding protein [Lacrimispora sp. 210928-DFI.3.58]MCB7319582.1 cell wall-binding protein [Lacrimispora sp. 210928-DFI.3.58]